MRAFATELDVAGIAIAPVNYVIISLIVMLAVGWLVATAFGSLLAAPAALIVPLGAYYLAHYLADAPAPAVRRSAAGQPVGRRLGDARRPAFLGALQAVVEDNTQPVEA